MTKRICLLAALASSYAVAATPVNSHVPLFFVANQGQAPAPVRYMARGSGLTAFFLQREVVLQTREASVHLSLEGASPASTLESANPMAGRANFFLGAAENWRVNLPLYGEVAYSGVYPGVDMTYGASERNLKSEFVVAPWGNAAQIEVRYTGARAVRINAGGELEISLGGEMLRERAPDVYQIRDGKRTIVEGRFREISHGLIGFRLGAYDHSLPLVIDPVISYSTFIGGSSADSANAMALDSAGNVYIAGTTASLNFPSLNAIQLANGGGNDAFVAKLNATGNALVYATYLGGRGDDRGFGVAVDTSGNAYVTGWTQSANFPVQSALQGTLKGAQNAFLAKLSPTGNSLTYSTYLGGSGSDSGNGIAIDSSGNAYVVGDTTSSNFPATAFQTTYHGGQDAFVAKINATGSALAYSTYLGGSNLDHGAAIAVDSTGTAYATGSTNSTDFPLANAYQSINGGGLNAFVTRIASTGLTLIFSTFLGGSGGRTGYPEGGNGIALDSSGNAYIAGVTSSTNFPVLNPLQAALDGSSDAFVAKMSSAGALVYSTFLGGSGTDAGNAIAVDSGGNTYVTGYTYSSDLPVTSAVQATIGSIGSTDAFVAKLNAAGNSLTFLTYLGGSDSDSGSGIAVDSAGSIYVAGWTLSSNFPTVGAYQTVNGGNYSAFVTKYIFAVGPVNVGVNPSSGSGPVQTFAFTYSDSNGASDLTSVAALFNTSTAQTNACSIIYNHAQNSLALLTNAGVLPGSTISPGSGVQLNSQCTLNGALSSVSAVGNQLTLNLAISFSGTFNGSKNVYLQSSNPFQTTAWQAEGTWSIPSSVTLAVTPSSGSGTTETFNFSASDPLGAAADLISLGVLLNTSTGVVSACSVTYTQASNTLALTTDAGGQPAGTITPGSGSQSNSQCTLNGLQTTVSVVGNTLTLNLSLTFLAAFGGVKNVYVDAVTKNGAINWTQEGTWTVPPGVILSVSPSSGSANQQTFSILASDSTGFADLTTVGALWNTTATTTAACAVIYSQAQNTLMLLTDTGAQPASSIPLGTGTQQNSQCILNGAGSSVVASGTTLSLNLAITFLPAFSGAKNIYLEAANPFETINWTLEGTWTSPPAVTLSVSPAAGSGATQTFVMTATDSLAATDISSVGILFNSSISLASACSVTYNRAAGTLALLTDAGAQSGSILPGSGSQQNSQCILNGAGSSVTVSGTTLTVTVSIVFQPAFTGTKNIYMEASNSFTTGTWQLEGTWISASAPSITVTPSSGSGTQQTFGLQVTDPLGATDLATIGLLFNTSNSIVNACAVTYSRASNTLALLLSSGAQPPTTITPGSGTQQNSACQLNGAGSSVSISGNVLTLNLSISFLPAFSGNLTEYAEAIGATQAIAWQQEGTWTVAPAITLGVTPLSGSGTQQSFTVQVNDSLAGTDVTTAGFLVNTSTATASACAVTYNRTQNTLALLTDAGAAPASTITPGSGSQSNSQCVLSGSGSSASVVGNNLIVNLAITFQPTFTGSKNIYLSATNPFETVNYQLSGTWVIPSGLTLSLTPSSGTSAQQTFQMQVADPAGATDLTTTGLMFNTSISNAGGCVVLYSRAQNTLSLLTDAGATPSSTISPGSGTQQNSQCVLNGFGSSASVGGNVLLLNVAITFQQTFTGTKILYAEALGAAQSLNWQQEGIWALPQIVSIALTPSTGTATQQTFNLQVFDSLGAADLNTIGILFNSSTSVASACAVTYNSAQNGLALITDSGAAPGINITPGSGSQQNSQCTLSGTGSTVSRSGNTITLNLAITFLPAFGGVKNVYAEAGSSFQAANWTFEGTWTLPAVVTMSMAPTSGGGPQETFSFQVTDSIAATDLTTVGVMFNSGISLVSGCVVMYNRALNTLSLLTDAGTASGSSITPGSASQSNSQCTLNGSGSTVVSSGTNLTLNLSFTFALSFVGTKSVSMEAINPYQSGTWTVEGQWVTSATMTVAEAPTSGTSTTATFNIQTTESWGASNVNTVGIMFNTSVSLAGGCVVIYSYAQNGLSLLTNSGATPSGYVVPGSSNTQQNSQCVLNGSGSSVSVVSTTLTVNVSLTFLPAFTGAQNIYVEAIDPFRTLTWTAQGVWSLPQGVNLSVSPSSGTASTQVFSMVVNDSLGSSDVSNVGLLFNTSTGLTSACAVNYNRAQNALTLLTDAGAAPSGSLTPGSGAQTNSQCTLNGAISSVTSSGNVLTVNISLTFLPAFLGAKNIYVEAATSLGAATWTLAGTWTLAPTLSMALTPLSGGGPQQVFSVQVTDSAGYSDLTTVGLLLNTSTATTSACAVLYNRAQNALTLLTDAGAAPSGSIAPGSGSQQNSQCTLNGAGSTVTTSGNTLTLNLSLSFPVTYVGTKTTYVEAINPTQSGVWTSEGRWVTSATLTTTETPASGSGSQTTFSIQVAESWGASNVSTVGLMINNSVNLAGGCVVMYSWALNTLTLLTNAGAAPSGSIVPGSGSQQNSQCTLNGAGSSVSAVGTVLTVNISLTFQPVFAGTQNVYVEAIDPFRTLTWAAEGTWTVPQGVSLAVTPASGSGTQQTFSLQISDSLGVTDLTTVGFLFNTSTSVTGACAVTYNRAQNTLQLLTDAGAAPSGSLTPGNGSQQNSQCMLNGAGSSVSTTSNTLTLNLAITFLPAFSGAKNLYLEAGSSLQTASWIASGTWTAPPTVTMAITPSSGGGPQQVFSLQVTDSSGAGDLSTVGMLFNTSVSTVSGCAVLYNQAQNALTLLTDAGAAPSGSITPGSGSQQNSQCTLNGAGSSVTASGTTLTVNLNLTFNVTWVGTKTTYAEAVNPYQAGAWTSEGRWVTSASFTVAATPTSGSGASVTFAIQATESWGATNVTTAGILINSSNSLTNGCVVIYNWTLNQLTLLNNAGVANSPITPGSGSVQNSQCVLNGTGSSVSAVSTVLTVNVSVTFLGAFAGTQNVYVEAVDPFRTLGWTATGTWTVPPGGSTTGVPISGIAMTASPSAGSGPQQTFGFQFLNSSVLGIGAASILIGPSANPAGGCAVTYNQAQDSLALLTDAGAPPATSITPGSGSQQNSQCTLDGAASSVTISGNTLLMNLSLSFAPAFDGVQGIYMQAAAAPAVSAWQSAGSWTVAPGGVSAVSVSPANGVGSAQMFNFRYTDTAGTRDVSRIYAWFEVPSDFGFANSCVVYYDTVQAMLYLSADGDFWQAPVQLGVPGAIANSQCSIDVGASAVTASGNDLILNLAMTFAPTYAGERNLLMRIDSQTVPSSGWSANGAWNAPQSGASGSTAPQSLAAVSVLPASGAGYRQSFNLEYADAAGSLDLASVWVAFAPDSGRTFPNGGCVAYYSQADNLLHLVTDSNDFSQSAAPGTSAVLANSQCSLDVSNTRVSTTNSNLLLVLPVTFTRAFGGSKTIFANAVSLDGASSGWTVQGAWSPSPQTSRAATQH